MTETQARTGSVAGDDRIRLFCGLQLGDDTVACFAAWQAEHLGGRSRVVPSENLHVTLAFLGPRPAGEVAAIGAELRAAAAGAGPIDLRSLRYRETAGVGMVVLEDVGGAAAALAADVQERLERLGVYRREARQWLPHVTVLRFRQRAGLTPATPNGCSIDVVRCALYRSSLGPGGARYDVLETAALGGR